MTDDIAKYLRLSGTRFNRHAEAADEIERLRNMLAHGLTLGYQCEGCPICDDLRAFHRQVTNDG